VRIDVQKDDETSSPILAAKPGFEKRCNYLGRSVFDPQKRFGWEAGIRTPITWSREAGSGVGDVGCSRFY
jgi:hypothetical protein